MRQVPAKVPSQRNQPLVIKRAAGVWAAASGSDSWKSVLPSQMLIRKEDAAIIIVLGTLLRECRGSVRYGHQCVHADVASRVHHAIDEVLATSWGVMRRDKVVQALQ